MPCGGLPRSGLDPVRPLGPPCAPPHVVYNSGPGGGEPTPFGMTQVRHVCTLGCSEQMTPRHEDVHQESRTEAPVAGGRGGPRKHSVILPGI